MWPMAPFVELIATLGACSPNTSLTASVSATSPTSVGMLKLLKHNNAGAFAHDEAIATNIEGPRSFFGVLVARAHCFHRAKAADAKRNDRRFSAAGEHHFGVAHFDRAPGFADGVI